MRIRSTLTITLVTASVLIACAAEAQPRDTDPPEQRVTITTVPPVKLFIDTPARVPSWLALELRERNPSLERVARRAGRADPELEKEFKLVRFRQFKTSHVETRQVGIARVRDLVTTESLPIALEIMRREDEDVRTAIMDAISVRKDPEAAIALAWVAIHSERLADREAAVSRLDSVLALDRVEARNDVAYLIARTLRSSDQDARGRAAQLANQFSIVQALPHMIAAQVGTRGGGRAIEDNPGDRAYIAIGQQTGFVSDLTPVVADNAVAFDPTISVLNTGVLLRIVDSSVVIYQMDIHNALSGLASRASGTDTSGFGFDQDRWWSWFGDDFQPAWGERVELAKAAEVAKPGGGG